MVAGCSTIWNDGLQIGDIICIKLTGYDFSRIQSEFHVLSDWLYFVFQIISAQQLPKINTEKASSIVDPQVWVEIHGVAIDNAKQKTQRIDNNGNSEIPLKQQPYFIGYMDVVSRRKLFFACFSIE